MSDKCDCAVEVGKCDCCVIAVIGVRLCSFASLACADSGSAVLLCCAAMWG